MNSKGHLICSIMKSALRILGCLTALLFNLQGRSELGVIIFIYLFLGAEILGVLEELFDRR